jgi:hypothetical protein
MLEEPQRAFERIARSLILFAISRGKSAVAAGEEWVQRLGLGLNRYIGLGPHGDGTIYVISCPIPGPVAATSISPPGK